MTNSTAPSNQDNSIVTGQIMHDPENTTDVCVVNVTPDTQISSHVVHEMVGDDPDITVHDKNSEYDPEEGVAEVIYLSSVPDDNTVEEILSKYTSGGPCRTGSISDLPVKVYPMPISRLDRSPNA